MNLIQLFELCLKAKEVGVDAFFDYLPHIDGVNLRVYENGWGLLRDEHGELVRDENGEPIQRNSDRNFCIYTDSELFKENMESAREYLTELTSVKKGAE